MKPTRILAFLLALLMTLSLCACGGGSGTPNQDSGGTSAAPSGTGTDTSGTGTDAPDKESDPPEPDIRPDIKAYIDELVQMAVEGADLLERYVAMTPEEQAEDAGFWDAVFLIDQVAVEWPLVPETGLTGDETAYYEEQSELVNAILSEWLEYLFGPGYDPNPEPDPEPVPSEDPLPEELEAILVAIEQMYADTYADMSAGAAEIFGRITDYASYLANHEELIAFYDRITERCLVTDANTLCSLATAYYKQVAQMPEDQWDRVMTAFFDRAFLARINCVDKFYGEDMCVTHYNGCYLYFITDEWQGSTSPEEWAEAKIAAQDEFYHYGYALVGATMVQDFHEKVVEGFASGEFDVDYLMAENN